MPPGLESIDRMVEEIQQSSKYRDLGIPDFTVRALLEQEMDGRRSSREVLKAARARLHNIMAPYLGDPDYTRAGQELQEAFHSGSPEAVKTACSRILACHASTRERLTILNNFYERIFNLTGLPQVILDIACGLNPLTFPWMNLPPTVCYHAYDIHKPRLDLVNLYFALQGLAPLAVLQDVLLQPPQVEADVVFLFKEAHRLEQRRRGCNLPLWKALQTRWLLVSLPSQSLTGRNDLADKQRRLVYAILKDEDWPVSELAFEGEIVFCIQKPAAVHKS